MGSPLTKSEASCRAAELCSTLRLSRLRRVEHLRWAQWAERPPFATGKRTGNRLQREGLRYESKLERHLRASREVELLAHPWIEYEDATGLHYAQPDFILTPVGVREAGSAARSRILLEAKRSASSAGEVQLRDLYLPLVEALLPGPWVLVQVALNAVWKRTALLELAQVLSLTPSPDVHLWHWRP